MVPNRPAELVANAVAMRMSFKDAGEQLEALPADGGAVDALVAAFDADSAPPWLTAYLLGCIGHASGYEVARRILLAAPGLLAESYAGVALAKIGGVSALDDLSSLVREAPKKVSREGAAYGIAHLKSAAAADAIVQAALQGLIRWNAAAGMLADLPVRAGQVIRLLRSDDGVRVGTELLSLRAASHVEGRPEWSTSELAGIAAELQATLRSGDVRMAPKKRGVLEEWVRRHSEAT